jgi:hypothetical protein
LWTLNYYVMSTSELLLQKTTVNSVLPVTLKKQ